MRNNARWNKQCSTKATNAFLQQIALCILDRTKASGDQVQNIRRYIMDGDFHSLCCFELCMDGLTADGYLDLAQVLAFYRKRKDLDIGVDREATALAKFEEAEEQCHLTNYLFRAWGDGRFQFDRHTDAVLHRAQIKISSILGQVPSFDEIPLRFGPGATTKVKKKDANPRRKIAEGITCSEDLLPVLERALEGVPHWVLSAAGFDPADDAMEELIRYYASAELGEPHDDVDLFCGELTVELNDSRLGFVPKNAKTHRGTETQPTLNMVYQLGIGDLMATRLARFGLSITDQSINQRLAREGSLTGALATLDLSSASDTISRELVRHLLPDGWFDLLYRFRCSHIEFRGERRFLSKFSGMGNGFTFPLETLIFFALVKSSCELQGVYSDKVSAFGDDLIVPTECVPMVEKMLHCVGFTVNRAKSFADGPFRESCGKDYWSGIDVRPIFVKDRLSPASLFVLHNFFYRAGDDVLADLIRANIHPSLQVFGPDGYGDGHLLGEWQRQCKKQHLADGWSGSLFDSFSLKPARKFERLPGDWVIPSYITYTSKGSLGYNELVLPKSLDAAQNRNFDRTGKRAMSRYLSREGCVPVGSDSPAWTYRKGLPGCVIPGSEGYKRISIYTLA